MRPWREERFSPDIWLQGYLKARYGDDLSPEVTEAWRALEHTVYNARRIIREKVQSNLCYVPVRDFIWTEHQPGDMPSYSIHLTQQRKQAQLLLSVADRYKGNNNLNMIWWTSYVESLADKANVLGLKKSPKVMTGKDKDSFRKPETQQFLGLILSPRQFTVHPKKKSSLYLHGYLLPVSLGTTEEEKKLYEWNASALITVWGDSIAANQGGLHDYSHRGMEWSLKDLYYQRWNAFF